MKTSTSEKKNKLYYLLSIAVWIGVWFILSLIVGEEIFLPSPLRTLQALFELLPTSSFWTSVFFSLSRIVSASALSFLAASLSAGASFFLPPLEILLSPLVKAMRSVPVASIIILTLLWVRSRNLSIVISFLMVFPIIYSAVLSGLKATPRELLEAADNYSVGIKKRIRYIYMPSLFPFVRAGLESAAGLAFKSSVAAEVIALPRSSIGSALYEAKVYLLTPDLFSWTIVIVILSWLFEKTTIFILNRLERRILK